MLLRDTLMPALETSDIRKNISEMGEEGTSSMSVNERDEIETFADLTREQVQVMRRPAWTRSGDDSEVFYFDGTHFWRQRSGRVDTPAPLFLVPLDGWKHAAECGCAICTVCREL